MGVGKGRKGTKNRAGHSSLFSNITHTTTTTAAAVTAITRRMGKVSRVQNYNTDDLLFRNYAARDQRSFVRPSVQREGPCAAGNIIKQ